ncbi:uncharacterized protein LOC105172298 [Sesamum indicum]|uniref:Uncharacterized protein LOC105172298 n=1 Tax=Sesamum indicum TaxID=4182 RepID=A0A6I9UCW1_SESIN|nr:uncharacterized protein LOC105172298 [Sesamum indicum]
MLPHFNSHLRNPNNQLHVNAANASAPPQVMGNPGNFGPNPIQVRPQFQVGMLNNPPLVMPAFTNPNTYFSPAQFFPYPQGSVQNLSNNSLPQFFTHNSVNPPQFLPIGQLNVPSLVKNVNQLLQMQMPNCGPQSSGLFANALLGVSNGNGVMQQSVDGTGLKHINHNAAVTKDFGCAQAQRNENVFSPGSAKSQNNAGAATGMNDRNSSFRKSHNKNFIGNHKQDTSQRGFNKRQFNQRQNAHGNRNLKFNNENRAKGNKNNEVKNFNFSNSFEQIQAGKRRSLVVNYTEEEIQQWREARRKNYPSNANMERLKQNPTQTDVTHTVSKMRRQQLKEVLAKQAELGCEVAEIPSCYLSDSETQKGCRQQATKVFGKRGRFPNKFDKKGKFHQSDWFSKRQKPEKDGSANSQEQSDQFTKKQKLANCCATKPCTSNKEPSLLKKLLNSDIKRDKKHLLQVFRFMVMNSFFEDWPEKPLKFPLVVVKESGDVSELVEEPQAARGDTPDGLVSTTAENSWVCTVNFKNSSHGGVDALDKNAASCSRIYAEAEDEDEDEGVKPQ